MENIMQILKQRFFNEPACAELREQAEHNHQQLREVLSPEDRKLVLRLVDAKDAQQNETSLAAFTCGFRVATEIYKEAFADGTLSEKSEACRFACQKGEQK